ncbi:Hypothetical predicted protein [Octopus vulgaris]|uniref:Uncharacterized protein n=1 Tax=Octopus vulgaris TaxID=6645 RepID=A0AA36BTB0_OCTVU|nr:Hypothetical predicted protein [Octopus vulgaris]
MSHCCCHIHTHMTGLKTLDDFHFPLYSNRILKSNLFFMFVYLLFLISIAVSYHLVSSNLSLSLSLSTYLFIINLSLYLPTCLYVIWLPVYLSLSLSSPLPSVNNCLIGCYYQQLFWRDTQNRFHIPQCIITGGRHHLLAPG